MQLYGIALNTAEPAAKAFAPLMRDCHVDLHEVTCVALEIRTPHQRAIDTRRRYLQAVSALHGVFDVEHRRQRARDRFAIFELHGAVGSLRHDLYRAAGLGGNFDPHQPIPHALQHGGCNSSDARADARLDNKPGFVEQVYVLRECLIGRVHLVRVVSCRVGLTGGSSRGF